MKKIPNIVADQNDAFRDFTNSEIRGCIQMTQGMKKLIEKHRIKPQKLLKVVQKFNNFNYMNDPHGEHDFGDFTLCGETCFWKIDLFDNQKKGCSPDPKNLDVTFRVLTLMLSYEY